MVETDDALVEHLLRIADGSADDTAERLRAWDPDRVAAAVLAEVMARAALFPGPATTLAVQFDLGTGERRLGYVATLTPDRTGTVRRGWADDPWLTVRQDLAELLRAVHGPPGAHDATREVVVKDPPANVGVGSDAPWLADLQAATLGSYQVVKACSPHHVDLDLLAVRFGSDKWGSHWYTPHYERHFAPFRQQRVKVLELGVGGYSSPEWGGGSLRMWRHYFPRGLVYGLDVFDKSALDRPRMKTVLGDQSDPVFLAGLADRLGPFEIVVDDGSHLSSDVLASFAALFPHVRPGGLYVIEDLQTSYWPGWNGGRTDPNDPATSTGMLKTLVDGLHHQDAVHDGPHRPSHTDRTVTGIHLYHNIAFIEKAVNSDQPAMSWLRKDVHPYASSGDPGAESGRTA